MSTPDITIDDFDLTAIYYTSCHAPIKFTAETWSVFTQAFGPGPINVVVKNLGANASDYFNRYALSKLILMDDSPRSQAAIYRQVLEGAKQAQTKYVACCEDDVLYHAEHFKFRPKEGHWGYNMNSWNLFTWSKPMFTQKPGGRRNLSQLICERQLLIEHLEERFKLWPDKVDINIFGEPGKYDNQLGTTPYPSESFYSNPPNIVFSHQTNLQFEGLGYRKQVGQIRATEVPHWGRAEDVRGLYEV